MFSYNCVQNMGAVNTITNSDQLKTDIEGGSRELVLLKTR